jgi:hypothetical protein
MVASANACEYTTRRFPHSLPRVRGVDDLCFYLVRLSDGQVTCAFLLMV